MKLIASTILVLQVFAVVYAGSEHFEPREGRGTTVLMFSECPDPTGGSIPCVPGCFGVCSCVCCHAPVVVGMGDAGFVQSVGLVHWDAVAPNGGGEAKDVFRPPKSLS